MVMELLMLPLLIIVQC